MAIKAEKDPGPHGKELVIYNRKLRQDGKGTDRQSRHGSCSLGVGGPEQPATESLGRAFLAEESAGALRQESRCFLCKVAGGAGAQGAGE